jgi:uncharacterized protein (TIGR02996 family)
MTSEEDFQGQLDETPADHMLRAVFADFLEERGDIRAGGYRALSFLGIYPKNFKDQPIKGKPELEWAYWWDQDGRWITARADEDRWPKSYFYVLPESWIGIANGTCHGGDLWSDSRRFIEDRAAIGWWLMHPEIKKRLFAGMLDSTLLGV